jgi:hypothetical protein
VTHLIEVWRLPAGATLLTNGPDFTPSTNDATAIDKVHVTRWKSA